MTARRNTSIGPDTFPLLAQFAAGYLHQDFLLEHQTPLHALDAFVDDASAAERASLAGEAARFRALVAGRPWSEVRRAFELLGGAWRPRSSAALDALLDAAVERSAARRRRRQR